MMEPTVVISALPHFGQDSALMGHSLIVAIKKMRLDNPRDTAIVSEEKIRPKQMNWHIPARKPLSLLTQIGRQ